jgi:TnpA family transposase
LTQAAAKADADVPENEFVTINGSELVLHKHNKDEKPAALAQVDKELTARLPEKNILDILVESEGWLDLHKQFGPLSGFEAKIDDPRKRFVTTLFCYGCNLGPTQTARSVKGLSRKQVAWLNLHHMTEDRLDKATVQVINAYNKFRLPKYWGTGKSASADGTKWNMYEQNLLSEYHIRYGGYGGIGYYHVSDMYIALFSHFIPCGVYEAIYILDIFPKNESDVQPDTLHGDTHAQSAPVFGLAYLLGIKLMPRIRQLKKLVFFKPDRGIRYKHINGLFSEAVDWDLIETHLPDMLRIALSIKAGKITPSTILRRLGTASRKNKLYFAFRELGRVVRTEFLLKYICDVELRKTINAATNKSEEFNQFIKWLFFGQQGVIAENVRHEQRKVVKYNQLVANLTILHNVEAMTGVLKEMQEEGLPISEEILGGLGPYRTEHINRLGDYTLDMDREIRPMNYKAEIL